MTRTPAQLATQLVEAFGRPDEIVAVLADDAIWWITPSVPPEIMQRVSTGREVIRDNMQRVFTHALQRRHDEDDDPYCDQ
ncbi:MAG: hypothetical protein QOC69_4186 [Mycobacterium sp.]|jgi:hypothetical protein|nr:hypothetical protein [Mycobacterium sp.]